MAERQANSRDGGRAANEATCRYGGEQELLSAPGEPERDQPRPCLGPGCHPAVVIALEAAQGVLKAGISGSGHLYHRFVQACDRLRAAGGLYLDPFRRDTWPRSAEPGDLMGALGSQRRDVGGGPVGFTDGKP